SNPCYSTNAENFECAARLRMPDCRLPRPRSCCPELEESRCSKLRMLSCQEICLPPSVFRLCIVRDRHVAKLKRPVRPSRDEAKRLASMPEEIRSMLENEGAPTAEAA